MHSFLEQWAFDHQWEDDPEWGVTDCGDCHHEYHVGHASDCPLATALSAAGFDVRYGENPPREELTVKKILRSWAMRDGYRDIAASALPRFAEENERGKPHAS